MDWQIKRVFFGKGSCLFERQCSIEVFRLTFVAFTLAKINPWYSGPVQVHNQECLRCLISKTVSRDSSIYGSISEIAIMVQLSEISWPKMALEKLELLNNSGWFECLHWFPVLLVSGHFFFISTSSRSILVSYYLAPHSPQPKKKKKTRKKRSSTSPIRFIYLGLAIEYYGSFGWSCEQLA